jgi:hypothetical protein
MKFLFNLLLGRAYLYSCIYERFFISITSFRIHNLIIFILENSSNITDTANTPISSIGNNSRKYLIPIRNYCSFLSVGQRYFNTSSILNSSINSSSQEGTSRNTIEGVSSSSNSTNTQSLSSLDQLEERRRRLSDDSSEEYIKYKDKHGTDPVTSSDTSSFGESFPWFVDCNNNIIDFNKSIQLFDSLKLISRYLETRFGLNISQIPDVKLTQILEILTGGTNVTVLDLYKHLQELYNKDYFKVIDKDGSNVSESSSSNTEDSLGQEYQNLVDFYKVNKPLGSYGDITLNQLILKLKEIKLADIENVRLTVNPLTIFSNVVGYGFLVRNYYKYIHNRPFRSADLIIDRRAEVIIRRTQLNFVVLVRGPAILYGLSYMAITYKDMGSIEVLSGKSTNNDESSNLIKSGLFFSILSKLKQKFPDWVRYSILTFIIYIIILLLVCKFSGLTFWFIYTYVSLFLVIMFQLVNLYLLHIFSTKKIKIPEVLPDFIIDWLKGIELFSQKKYIKSFKKDFYIQLCIYLIILVLTLLVA